MIKVKVARILKIVVKTRATFTWQFDQVTDIRELRQTDSGAVNRQISIQIQSY